MELKIEDIQRRTAEFAETVLEGREIYGNIGLIYGTDGTLRDILVSFRYRLAEPKIPFDYADIIIRAGKIGEFLQSLFSATGNLEATIILGGKRRPVVSLFYGPAGNKRKGR